METVFIAKSFIVGILAASGVGPIFVLTFNRGALHGFLHGFATALGAAIADAVFFVLAFVGVLAAFENSRRLMMSLDFVGGVLLLFLGVHMYRKAHVGISVNIGHKERLSLTFFRSFVLTVINPLTILYFMLAVTKILPEDGHPLSPMAIALGTLMVVLGSLCVLGSVSLFASMVGHRIEQKTLQSISFLTCLSFFFISFYLLGKFISRLYYG